MRAFLKVYGLWLLCSSLFVTAAILLIDQWLIRDPYNGDTLIHMPASGACPEGFVVMPKIFVRDGRAYDGCLRTDGVPLGQGGKIDVLGPGEGVEFGVPFRPEVWDDPDR